MDVLPSMEHALADNGSGEGAGPGLTAAGTATGSRSALGRTSLRDQRCGGKRCMHQCSIEPARRALWNRCHGLSMPAMRSGPRAADVDGDPGHQGS